MIELKAEMTAEEFRAWQNQTGQGRPITVKRSGRSGKSSDDVNWHQRLLEQIQLVGLPTPRKEYSFHPERRWRFDVAWVSIRLAVEVDGGIHGRPVTCHNCGQTVKRRLKNGRWMVVREGGRHNTGSGFEADAEKLNEAVMHGWAVLRATSKSIEDGSAVRLIERVYRLLAAA